MSLMQLTRTLGARQMLRMRKTRQQVWEQLIAPHFSTRSVQTLFNIGLMDAFRDSGSVDVAKFADAHELDSRLLVAMCDALFSRKILRKTGETTFELDEIGHLVVDEPLARGWFELVYGYEDVLHRMEDMVRRKAAYGNDGLVRNGQYVATGSGLASLRFYFPLAIDLIRRSGARRVLDIGCGDGTFLRYLREQIPGIQGVGVDLSPEAVEEGNRRLEAAGASADIKLHVCDAVQLDALAPQLAGVDAATTFFVLHEMCDRKENKQIRQFLTTFRATLPQAQFHIFETIRPSAEEMRKRQGPAVEYFLLHDLSNQNPISREAWMKLFAETGFRAREQYIDFARSSIFTLG